MKYTRRADKIDKLRCRITHYYPNASEQMSTVSKDLKLTGRLFQRLGAADWKARPSRVLKRVRGTFRKP